MIKDITLKHESTGEPMWVLRMQTKEGEDARDVYSIDFVMYHVGENVWSEAEQDWVPELDDEDVIEGHLKWDGCLNWRCEGYMHFCMHYSAEQMFECFKQLRLHAKELMPLYIGCGADGVLK